MKHLLLTTIAAVLVVGCGPPEPPEGSLGYGSPEGSIISAAEVGDIEAVKQHLAAGTDVNAKTSLKQTPLHEAARYGHKEVVELLIAESADLNAKEDLGGTLLYIGRLVKVTRKSPNYLSPKVLT